MSATTIPQLLTPHDVGQILHMPTTRVLRLARTGLIPHVLMPTGELLFEIDDLVRWIGHQKRQAEEGLHAAH